MKKINYVWVIIGICFLVIMTSLGLCSSGRTLYLTAITSALGIPRGAFAFTDTFRYITTTIVNLYFGRLVQRFGTKKLICAGFLCLIVSVLLSSVATNWIPHSLQVGGTHTSCYIGCNYFVFPRTTKGQQSITSRYFTTKTQSPRNRVDWHGFQLSC